MKKESSRSTWKRTAISSPDCDEVCVVVYCLFILYYHNCFINALFFVIHFVFKIEVESLKLMCVAAGIVGRVRSICMARKAHFGQQRGRTSWVNQFLGRRCVSFEGGAAMSVL
jgi:hypothetical protein